jgi:hypothetical protein
MNQDPPTCSVQHRLQGGKFCLLPWPYFLILRLGEVRRIPIPRTRVNKGMKTKLGLPGVVWAAVGVLPGMAEKNRIANAADANTRTVLLTLYSFP